MPEISTQQNEGPQVPPHLVEVIKRASAGDEAALKEVKKAFDEDPELARYIGDLKWHAEQSLIRLAAGENPVIREAIATQIAELRANLHKIANSPLEKLLVDRIVLSWIAVYHCEMEVTEHRRSLPGNSPATAAAVKRLGSANNRYLASIKALAQVQKLLKRAPSPIQIATRLNTSPVIERRNGTLKQEVTVAN